MLESLRETPPTAGLPLGWSDFVRSPPYSLDAGLATLFDLPSPQIECSGTAALIVILATLKQNNMRRTVIIPAYTCPLVPLAIRHCGLEPVLCDVRPGHFDLSPQALEKLCSDDTLAIVVTHLGGRVADLATAAAVANRHGARVIEDAAQALGARYRNQPVGTVGDAGFFSLAVGKGLTLYEGGVLVTRDAGLRRAFAETSARMVPDSRLWEIRRLVELAGYAALYRPYGLRMAYGMPRRHALRRGRLIEAVGDDFSPAIPLHRVGARRRAIGANALSRLPAFLGTLAAQAMERKERLAQIPGIALIDDPAGDQGAWPFLMVLMPSKRARDAALARLWPTNLGVSRLFIHALPDYPYLAGDLGNPHIPGARDLAARLLTISNSPWLNDAGFARLCAVLAAYV